MSRDLTVAFVTALADQSLRPVIFFEGQFATGWVRIWSGLGEVSWNGESWAGAGSLLGLGPLGETGEVVAGGTAVSLSGVPLDLVQMAIEEARQIAHWVTQKPGGHGAVREATDLLLKAQGHWERMVEKFAS